MYIVNPEKVDMKRLYKCNDVIANWLIYTKHLPPFGRRKDKNGNEKEWYFAKTEEFEKAISEIPFYLNIAGLF